MPKSLGLVPPKDAPYVKKELLRLSNALQRSRVAAGLTQEAFAEELGISKDMVSRIERGDRIPSVPMLLRMGKILNSKFILP